MNLYATVCQQNVIDKLATYLYKIKFCLTKILLFVKNIKHAYWKN